MNKTTVSKAVLFALAFSAASIAQAQRAETINAPVVSQPGPTSPYARASLAPRGTILVDEFTGRFVTHPTGGVGGAPASAVQTALTMTTYGAGSQLASNNWMAEDFTVPSGGLAINTVRFYTYQTGSTTTSTANDLRIRIFSGTPTGTPVFGDTTTNRLSTSAFSGVYRVLDTGLTNNQRPVMEVVANFATPIALTTPGTYWIAWTIGGTLASGPWTPPQTVLGQTTTGNCQQSIGGAAFTPFIDGDPTIPSGSLTPQGCPFVLEGVTVPVQLQSFGID